jgi:hypothetical protein
MGGGSYYDSRSRHDQPPLRQMQPMQASPAQPQREKASYAPPNRGNIQSLQPNQELIDGRIVPKLPGMRPMQRSRENESYNRAPSPIQSPGFSPRDRDSRDDRDEYYKNNYKDDDDYDDDQYESPRNPKAAKSKSKQPSPIQQVQKKNTPPPKHSQQRWTGDDDDDDWNEDDDDWADDGYGKQTYNDTSPPYTSRSKHSYSSTPPSDKKRDKGNKSNPSYVKSSPTKKKSPIAYKGGSSDAGPLSPDALPFRRDAVPKFRPPVKTYSAADKPVSKPHGQGNGFQPPALPAETPLHGKDRLYYSREPRHVSYKPMTVEEYKLTKPQRYVEIENVSILKPDLNSDELVAKRANADRVKEFSKNLKHFNKQSLGNQKKVPSGQELVQASVAKSKVDSKREKMLEFAKNIPKPKIKPDLKAPEFEHGYMMAPDKFGMPFEDASKLQELEAKHIESQAQVEAIKKSLGMGR